MAQKTNKTAHVLSLLAEGTNEEKDQKATDSSTLAPNISIEDNPTSSADPLAGLIRNTLNKELLQEDENNAENAVTDALEDNTATADTAPEDTIKLGNTAETDASPEADTPPAADSGPKTKKKASTKTGAKTAKGAKTSKADESLEQMPTVSEESAASQAQPESEASVSAQEVTQAPQPAANEYVYLNMMDILVEERLMEFLNKFGACTCHRCVLDAKALALSNLPPKYLVIPDSSTAPLTSFYRNKFSIYIITELTKACLAIINSPRH